MNLRFRVMVVLLLSLLAVCGQVIFA